MASPVLQKTDYTRWRLKTEDGRQTWHYLDSDEHLAAWPQTTYDKYHLGMDTVRLLLLFLLVPRLLLHLAS